jgi:cytochrome P450
MLTNERPIAPGSIERLFALDEWALDHQAEVLSELRAAGPVVWIPKLGVLAVTEHAAVVEALNDTERFSSRLGNPRGPRVSEVVENAARELADDPTATELLARLVPDWTAAPTLIGLDPPHHSAHRRVVNRLFTPRKVAGMRPRVEAIAGELVDDIASEELVDMSTRFAVPLPLRVIAEELAIGVDDLPAFKRWSDDMVAPIGNDRLGPPELLGIIRTLVEFAEHFRPKLAERRENPRDDFLTLVAQAEDDEFPINDEQRLGIVAAMLGAGNETSTKMLSSGCAILARCPDLADRLRAEPDLIPAFVDEVLRLEAPVQGLFRMARHDTTLAGVPVPAGAWLWILYASANRSEREYECPHEVKLDRSNGASHLTFGRGAHYCPGAALARLEGAVGFRALLARFDGWEIVDYQRDPSYVLHGFKHLNVRFV